MSDLPKDVGLCAKCSAKNSKHATKCHTCGEVLPWAAPKAKAKTPVVASAAGTPKVAAKKIANPLDSIDIGGTIGAIGLFLGVFLLSSTCWIAAYFLYRHFDNEESPLRYAAAAGFWLTMLSFMGRMFLLRNGTEAETVEPGALFFFLPLF